MPPRPSTRKLPAHWQERGAERPPDPAEVSKTPPTDAPRHQEVGPGAKNPLDHQADVVDPTSDGDPYADAETEGLVEARAAKEHLRRADPVLRSVIDEVVREGGGEPPTLSPDPDVSYAPDVPTDRYGVLVRSIVNQNLSNSASRSIFRRLLERFDGHLPTPQEILDDDPEALRHAVGVSRAKTASLRSLAQRIVSGELQLERLHELSDEDVLAQLDAVKGIGPWTADMFLMFHLQRPDVLPVGDLGLRRAVERAYGLDGAPRAAELERIAEPWRPYRTLACIYLWRMEETTPQV
jgi:DNA-3-methyladenine glycosylase II